MSPPVGSSLIIVESDSWSFLSMDENPGNSKNLKNYLITLY